MEKKGVDLVRGALGITSDDTLVACVGRLRREKGQDILLRSHEKLAMTFPKNHLVLVGDGPDRGHLERSIQARQIPRVHLVGHQEDPWRWYQACDVVAIPSRSDSLPLGAIEAMASGKPTVAMKVGGIPEIIRDDVEGLLIDPPQAEALSAGLARLLTDEQARRQFGSAAVRRYKETFTTDAMLDRWERFYGSVLSARGV